MIQIKYQIARDKVFAVTPTLGLRPYFQNLEAALQHPMTLISLPSSCSLVLECFTSCGYLRFSI